MTDDHRSFDDRPSPNDLSAYQHLAPGWYRDAASPNLARYWDGERLSEETRPVAAAVESSAGATSDLDQDEEIPVSDLRQEVQELRQRIAVAEGHLSSVVDASTDGVVVVDSKGVIVFVNVAGAEMLGKAAAEIAGEVASFPLVVTPAEPRRQEPGYAELRVTSTVWEGQPAVLALLRDVTERHKAAAETAFRATHDPLTGLPNRYLLNDRLAQELARDRREPRGLAVLFCDVDRLKAINDRYGHNVGDHVLVEVAQRIVSAIRPFDTAARVGGDEFVVLCTGIDRPVASAIADRLVHSFDNAMMFEAVELDVNISVGLAVTNDPDAVPEVLLAEADRAMYQSKRQRTL
jgi:diguanylate cyclase (GGDEF)-like protein